jgi:hypothetical protein
MFCFVLIECVERRAVVRRTGLATLTRRLARIPWLYTAARSKREEVDLMRLLSMRLAVGAWYSLWRLETYEHQDGVGSCCSIEVSLCEARLAQHDTVRKSKLMHAHYASIHVRSAVVGR